MPSTGNLVPLMNCSFELRKHNLVKDAMEIDVLVGLALMSGRKFIQSCESFRKLQYEILKQAEKEQEAGT